MKNFIKNAVILFYKVLTKVLPVRKNVIVFCSNLGRNYTGNPRFIYENMVERNLDTKYLCIWFFNEPDKIPIIGHGRRIKYQRIKYLYYMAVAGIWVFDCRQPSFLIKKKSVKYIQTWHGTPLKKLALDLEDISMAGEESLEEYKRNFKENTKTWDYLISQNKFSTETFRRAFDYHNTILEIGYPRNDILINSNNAETISKIKYKWNLPNDKKIILYAPTWRDDEFYGLANYKFNPNIDFNLLKNELSNEFIMIVKYHYLVKDEIDWSSYKGFIYNFDNSYDISELYLISDMLITDYSSVMFDYSLLKRPMFFYAYDLDNYKNNLRGFYFDFMVEAPGPISQTTQQLINDIFSYDSNNYAKKYMEFWEKYNHIDNGLASKQVVDIMEGK